jgi:hypothetical protein
MALSNPPAIQRHRCQILIRWKYLFPLAGILVSLLEFGYPFFIWSSKTRKIWFFGVRGMHIIIGVTMGMYLFSLVMIVLNVAAFGGRGCFADRKNSLFYSLRQLLREVV